MNKPKIHIMNFEAEETLQRDITRFKNLMKKLKVKIKCIESPEKIRGYSAPVVICDESVEYKDGE